MIGILYVLLQTGAAVASGVSDVIRNETSKTIAKELQKEGKNPYGTYYDCRGRERLLENGTICSVDVAVVEDDGQDRCVRNVHGEVIRNLSEEESNERKENAIKDGRTTYLYRKNGNGIYNGKYHLDRGGDGYCWGTQLKDLTTGDIYVARRFLVTEGKKKQYTNFYMDLNGLLVREADSDIYKRKIGENVLSEEAVKEFIKKFNNKQNGNGWYDCKDKIVLKDNFGKAKGFNQIYLRKYYCNENDVSQDV